MQLINSTRMACGYSLGMELGGRELLVVVIKGTFRIPDANGAPLVLAEEQQALVMADTFYGEPGRSAPMSEAEFAPRKSRCDVLLNGTAYAPEAQPVERMEVGVRIGSWSKHFAVVGDRLWHANGAIRPTKPQPFTAMPIHYDRAFGGFDARHEDPAQLVAFPANPSGRGFHKHLKREWVHGAALPNTEELKQSITRPDGTYAPMAFGPLGRHWHPRSSFTGTYDQHWIDEVAPFLPADFDERYYQAAPADQQLPMPIGEQAVTLLNLTRDGQRSFRLPYLEAPVHVFPAKGPQEDYKATVDTIAIEPDLGLVTMCWRVARPLKRNLFEIREVMVGRQGREWWQKRGEVVFPIPIVVERLEAEES